MDKNEPAREDAWGNSGEEETCMSCDGSGTEYGETCVTCGGLGWTCWPTDDDAMIAASKETNDGDC